MNEIVLNELSFRRFREPAQPCIAATPAEGRSLMEALVRTLAEASRSGFPHSLRTLEAFSYQELAPDYTMAQWRNDAAVERDLRQFFRRYATRSPLLDGVLHEVRERALGCEARFEGVEAKGLLAAFLLGDLAASVPSESVWRGTRLSVQITELEEDGRVSQTDEIVRNVSSALDVQEVAPEFTEARRLATTDGRHLVDHRPSLLPHLRFCGEVDAALSGLGENADRLRWVRARLFDLNDTCISWTQGEFPHHRLAGRPSLESQSVYENEYLRRLRLFRCDDGQVRYFEWHLKNNFLNIRLHYFPKTDERIVLVGYIGRHLPTSKY
jgi:hypothetical protein